MEGSGWLQECSPRLVQRHINGSGANQDRLYYGMSEATVTQAGWDRDL